MTAPPKGSERNFINASLLQPPARPLNLHRELPDGRMGEGEKEIEGEGRDRGVIVPPASSSPLLQPALVCQGAYDPFSPDMRKLLTQRKKAVNQCY